MRGHLGPACNAVGYVDRQVWGVNHLYSQPVWRRLKASNYIYNKNKQGFGKKIDHKLIKCSKQNGIGLNNLVLF
jgi:hypothetical protein